MSDITRFWAFSLLALAVATFGCNNHPKEIYNSSHRVLALKLIPATPTETFRIKFLYDTNSEDGDIMPGTNGQFGKFQGNISVITLSSNANMWRVELMCVGALSGSSLRQTNILEMSYPQGNQLSLGRIGSVTCWFLSDEQLLDYDKGSWQNIDAPR